MRNESRGNRVGWRIKVKDVGRDTGTQDTQYARGCLSFLFTYLCVLFASDTCLSWFDGSLDSVSTLLLCKSG